ncbi:hypothetical protein ACQ4M3_37345 [Leptolyngbya sp. AN03gr2]|uniref:hypothetical protein n=1 Tax=Leptolyngbya sp. AN03gr2 TaxID=3423364 RepID=UPI003D3128D0
MAISQSQIREAIFDYFKKEPKIAADCWKQVQAPQSQTMLNKTIVTPLMTEWLCLYYCSTQTLPYRPSELYRECYSTVLDNCCQLTRNKAQIHLMLEQIGWKTIELENALSQQQILEIIQVELAQNLNGPQLSAEEILKLILETRILQVFAPNQIEFDNDGLATYFAASLVKSDRTESTLIQLATQDLRWHRVVILLSEMLPSSDALMKDIAFSARHSQPMKNLLMQCRHSAARLSPKAWNEIQAQLA